MEAIHSIFFGIVNDLRNCFTQVTTLFVLSQPLLVVWGIHHCQDKSDVSLNDTMDLGVVGGLGLLDTVHHQEDKSKTSQRQVKDKSKTI